MKKTLLLAVLCSLVSGARAQVGINTPTPDASAALEISDPARGLLIPRVALTSTTDATTITSPATSLLVYNTTNDVGITMGYYLNAGTPTVPQWQLLVTQPSLDATNVIVANLNATGWRTTGNALTGTGKMGSTSNYHVDLLTNNTVRGRLAATGEFLWGTTSVVTNGDLAEVVGTSAKPFALAGYSSFNGSGVYGSVRGINTTSFAAVLGENTSTAVIALNASAVRGINSGSAPGTGFRALTASGPKTGVAGVVTTTTAAYSFGVHGSVPGLTTRTGGLFGDEAGFGMGAVGYFASNSNDYSFYGFGGITQTGTIGGRSANGSAPATAHIGLGLYGGVMGGWVRGQVYGLLARGARYSLYVDGPAVTNQPLAQLVTQADGQRVATYVPSAPTADVYVRGRAALRDGQVFVPFPPGFGQLLSNPQEATITVTPTGDTRGVYVERVTEEGFYVRENQGGRAQAALNWTATGIRRGYEAPKLAAELLDKEFDPRMTRLMRNEADSEAPKQSLWWDGQQPRYDTPPAHQPDPNVFIGARPQSETTKH